MAKDKERRTGLGTSAFFQQRRSVESEPELEELALEAPTVEKAESIPDGGVEEPEKPKKVRTTVMFPPETLAALEMLKVDARRQGQRATYSDILAEAIHDLARKKGIGLSD